MFSGCENEKETIEHVYKCSKGREIINSWGNTVIAEAERFKQCVAIDVFKSKNKNFYCNF